MLGCNAWGYFEDLKRRGIQWDAHNVAPLMVEKFLLVLVYLKSLFFAQIIWLNDFFRYFLRCLFHNALSLLAIAFVQIELFPLVRAI
jgi:hypothetical protein